MSNIFIIAELSANHNNDLDVALETVRAIAKTGADAVKVQTYTADSLSMDIDNEFFGEIKSGPWKGRRPYELYQEASMPYEWHKDIQALTKELGLEFFSSPFDIEAVDFLEDLNVSRYKIASFEITDIPLIQYAASKAKPIIMSTGVAQLEDIENAILACRKVGNDDITLLKCTSQYPAKIEQANLIVIPDLAKKFNVKVGLSDHTMGYIVPMAAVALGATVIEKHFILDRKMGGPDSAFSMQPEEFELMVKNVRQVEKSLGTVGFSVSENDKLRRRSLFVTDSISAGEQFTEKNIKSKRPGHGLAPSLLEKLIGKKATKNLKRGEPLNMGDVKWK